MHVAVLKAYSIPSIASKVSGTGDQSPTSLILSESLYSDLSEEELRYLVCLIAVEPVRWVDVYGYRKLSKKERQSQFLMWYSIGQRMGVSAIPESLEIMTKCVKDFEERFQNHHPRSPQLAKAATDLFLSHLPIPTVIKPLATTMLHSLLDKDLQKSLKIQPSQWLLKLITEGLLWCHGVTVGYMIPESSYDSGVQCLPIQAYSALTDEGSGSPREHSSSARQLRKPPSTRRLDQVHVRQHPSRQREFRRFKVE